MERRYTVISADSHCGADVLDYRPYLAKRFHDEFDAWAATYEVPFADLLGPIRYRNWDSERRLAEHEADGIVAEVLFPNTVPPFFEEGNLVALPPSEADYERRWAGVQAHNRWVADFCAAAPGRRAGVAQVFVNRLDDALAEISWAAEHVAPLRRASSCPSIPPGSRAPPAVRPALRPAVAALRGASAPSSTSTAGSGSPTTATWRSPGPSCWSSCPGSATVRCGTSSSAASSSASPA